MVMALHAREVLTSDAEGYLPAPWRRRKPPAHGNKRYYLAGSTRGVTREQRPSQRLSHGHRQSSSQRFSQQPPP